jgi:predicted nucleotidyltransferase
MTSSVAPAETARFLRRRAERREQRGKARAEHLRRNLSAAARLLRDRYDAERVIVFGSLATGTCREHSDVDLAVVGLPGEAYFPALSDLMALFGAAVDLVRLEEAPKSLRQRIEAEGEVL